MMIDTNSSLLKPLASLDRMLFKKISIMVSIGIFSGLCAAFIPRLSAALTFSGDVDLFKDYYIYCSIIFAVFIGIATMILEWDKTIKPRDLFIAALAIPSLFSGSINMVTSAMNVQQLESENISYVDRIQDDVNVDQGDDISEEFFNTHDSHTKINYLEFPLINNAYAIDNKKYVNSNLDRFGIRKRQDRFIVVLGKYNNQGHANNVASDLQKKNLGVGIEVIGNQHYGYIVTTNTGPQVKGEALIEAIRLKNHFNLKPSLSKIE